VGLIFVERPSFTLDQFSSVVC